MSRPVGPYSPVVRAGAWLVTSGQLGVRPGPDGAPVLVEGGTATQVRQALDNLGAVLATEGAGPGDVVKATVFLVDMADFPVVNAAWAEWFGQHRPARSAVGVAGLPLGARVEIEAWAVSPSSGRDPSPTLLRERGAPTLRPAVRSPEPGYAGRPASSGSASGTSAARPDDGSQPTCPNR